MSTAILVSFVPVLLALGTWLRPFLRRNGPKTRGEGGRPEAEEMCIDPASVATVTLVLTYSARTFPLDRNVYLEWLSLCDSC